MSGDILRVATPVAFSTSGSFGRARFTRFCTSTWARFRSIPCLKVTVRLYDAVVGALRRHVEHVLHAVDLLLDRRRHRLGHDLRRWRRDNCS